jgi:hypothetical protein
MKTANGSRRSHARTATMLGLILTALAAATRPGETQTPPPDPLTASQMREDLDVFHREFFAADRAYSPAARTRAEAMLADLAGTLETTTRAQFELTLAKAVALADNGHTTSFGGPRARRFNRVPVRLTPFGEQFHVLWARPAHADLLGARLIGIGARPIAELRDSARTLTGGTPAWRDRSASFFLESPEQLAAAGLLETGDAAGYVFETLAGDTVERRFVAEPPAARRADAGARRWLFAADETTEWRSLQSAGSVPWSFQDGSVPFRWTMLPELDAAIVDLRQNHDAPDLPIRRVVRAFADSIRDAAPRHLVLDMRLNGGGDLNTTRDFMRGLPDLVPGHIFVLMSPWTFSAAISSIGYLEQTAPERVTLVGEGPGDRLEFFAEGGVVRLPNSGVVLLPATERHDYRTGCRDKPDCHGSVVRHPIAVPSLTADLPAPWTIAAYAAGRDPAMEAVAAALDDGR